MKIGKKTIYTLELTEKELLWLEQIMQNPIVYDQGNDHLSYEDEASYDMREAFFKTLKEVSNENN